MQDDREDFEQEQVSRDGEGEEWRNELARAKFTEAMARLDAEVAEHEAEIEPYLVRHPEMLEDLVVRAPITPEEAARLSGSGPRFGDRLRSVLDEGAGYFDEDDDRGMTVVADDSLRALASAIDQDRDELRGWVRDEAIKQVEEIEEERRAVILAELKGTVRREVEQAVERLRFSAWNSTADDFEQTKNILDVEPFLAELDRIFGERPAEDGAALIARERRRQIAEEGWSAEHDDAHEDGELADAAACYAFNSSGGSIEPPPDWPWDRKWWKPRGPVKDLVRAGALIAAEIDRLSRRPPAEEPWPEHEPAHDRQERLVGEALAEVIDSTPWPDLTGDEDASAFVDRLEHEAAADRRERLSARNEDSRGRVEGVDR